MFFIDYIALILVLFASFSLRLGYFYLPNYNLLLLIFFTPLIAIPIFVRFGIYHFITRFIGFKSLWVLVKAVSLYSLLWGMVVFILSFEGVPRSVILINLILSIVVIVGIRMIARWFLSSNNFFDATNVVIYGAGSAGIQLSIALMQSKEYNPIAFIDDNKVLQGNLIYGINVISSAELLKLIKLKKVKEILLALPSASRVRRSEIFDFLEPLPVLVRSLPGVAELAQGKIKIDDLKEVSIKDLLGRDIAVSDEKLLKKNIKDKMVMVTGAGGSIGSEICRQILLLKPRALIMYDSSELSLYLINTELSNINISKNKVYAILGNINNKSRFRNVIKRFKVETIYHAAAYKHVPMVEFNSTEGVSNNVFGTLNCAEVAIQEKVNTFVMISTDKAVRPTNIMGATKRIAELVIQALAEQTNLTEFSIVRFGNVLDSSGSVIPLFRKQIKSGGPVTVTDKNITRYFMTIPEAVELAIQAGAMGKEGDVFVLNMGKPFLINELAKKMIRLSGLEVKDKVNPNGDIEIKYIGLRPGEKLYEELFIGDNISETSNPLIMSAEESMLKLDKLKVILDKLEIAVETNDSNQLRNLLIEAIPEFIPQSENVDLLFGE
jgi:FlaA1/EpsC-like NDP-sugar epimerase